MRLMCILSLVLFVGIATQAQAQQSDLEARYIKACIKDGDTEAYCRCDLAATKAQIKDPKEFEWIVGLAEKIAGLPQKQQDAILNNLSPEQQERLLAMAEQLLEVVKKCPDFRQR